MNTEAKLRRIAIEAVKLAAADPDVVHERNTFHCYIYPRKGAPRQIILQTSLDYPFVQPKVWVRPFADILNVSHHILSEGEVCYMSDDWDPTLHTLTFVFTQVKRIVYEAVNARYGA